jgi:hypothetical protein
LRDTSLGSLRLINNQLPFDEAHLRPKPSRTLSDANVRTVTGLGFVIDRYHHDERGGFGSWDPEYAAIDKVFCGGGADTGTEGGGGGTREKWRGGEGVVAGKTLENSSKEW